MRLRLMKVIGAVVVAVILLFLVMLFTIEINQSGFNPTLLITLIPAAAIIILLVVFIMRLSKGVKTGLPISDEMSQRIKERAGYLTSMISIYFILGVMFYHGFLVEDYGFPGLIVRHAMVLVLIFMLAVFGIIWFILSRRGIK